MSQVVKQEVCKMSGQHWMIQYDLHLKNVTFTELEERAPWSCGWPKSVSRGKTRAAQIGQHRHQL